jgi:uncharacterized protein YbaP (TraB family)
MHLATDEAYTFADLATQYIHKVAIYAAEMDLDEAANQNMSIYLTLPEGTRFSSFFRPHQYERYRKMILKAFQKDILLMESYTPFFLTNYLTELTLLSRRDLPLDHYLWNFARQAGKKLEGVESFDDQVRILQQIPIEFQLSSFKTSMRNISAFRKKIDRINRLYAQGDVENIYKMSKRSMGKLRKLMLYDRNIYMTNRICQISEKGPCFIAIGAAHISGSKGVISLLKKSGFRFKKIC